MLRKFVKILCLSFFIFSISSTDSYSQTSLKLKFKKSSVYAGIEVGSKGVKMSFIEISNKSVTNGEYNLVKDTSANTDFISFSQSSFSATLKELTNFFTIANKKYDIPSNKIFTVISSGVKVQSEKENKTSFVKNLIDSFKVKINEPQRKVEVIDVIDEARLSHLGIVPASKRYTTFLVDIGSGNTKGGYFPNENTQDLKLFQLTWGTKSIANAAEKRSEGDLSTSNYNKQLYRVLAGTPNTEITYAVNVSGAYAMSDNIAFSGGIAWSVATLLFPDMIDNSVVPVTYDDVLKFSEKLAKNAGDFSADAIVKKITDKTLDKQQIGNEVKKVNNVFDQRSLMAGTGLLLKIMRQFEGIYEKKQFFLVKNGQVGWISAYVDESIIGR
ncbi:MAG: hypothetical protein V4556_04335 [Bacteroidota bacterium]